MHVKLAYAVSVAPAVAMLVACNDESDAAAAGKAAIPAAAPNTGAKAACHRQEGGRTATGRFIANVPGPASGIDPSGIVRGTSPSNLIYPAKQGLDRTRRIAAHAPAAARERVTDGIDAIATTQPYDFKEAKTTILDVVTIS